LAAMINAMMISVNTASENIQGDAGAQPILHWVCHLNSSEGRAGGVSRGPSWTISLVPCKMGRSRFSGGGRRRAWVNVSEIYQRGLGDANQNRCLSR
jgi:hypothetical protein